MRPRKFHPYFARVPKPSLERAAKEFNLSPQVVREIQAFIRGHKSYAWRTAVRVVYRRGPGKAPIPNL